MSEVTELDQVAKFINGFAFKPIDWGSTGRKIIRIQNLTNPTKSYNRTTRVVPDKYIVRKGDILVSWSATLDVFEWVDEEEALLNQHIFKAELDDALIDRDYFKFALQFSIEKMTQFTHGSTMKHIVRKDFLKHKIPLPVLEEQKRIVGILTTANKLVQMRQQAIQSLDIHSRSVFLEMFGDPVSNPMNWDKKQLSEFGQIITGNTPSRANDNNYSSRHIEWIKTDNIKEDELYVTEATEFLSEEGLRSARYVTSGAVLIACIAGSANSIGRAAMTNRKVSFNQQINAIQPNDHVNPLFLYWLIKLSKSYILSHATSGMKKILTKGALQKVAMILPPIYLQNEFARKAEMTEQVKRKMLTQSSELETQFKALMQEVFIS